MTEEEHQALTGTTGGPYFDPPKRCPNCGSHTAGHAFSCPDNPNNKWGGGQTIVRIGQVKASAIKVFNKWKLGKDLTFRERNLLYKLMVAGLKQYEAEN